MKRGLKKWGRLLALAALGVPSVAFAIQIPTPDAPQSAPVADSTLQAGPISGSLAAPGANARRVFEIDAEEEGPLDINGYVDAGYYGNTLGADYNGPGVFSDGERGGALNGAYLAVAKEAATGAGVVDWGFGADATFGQDSRWLRVGSGLDENMATGRDKWGNETYGFALPQAYGTLAVNNLLLTGGHFYTSLGYEGDRADERFFYSTGYDFDALPSTHTGVKLTYSGLNDFESTVGFVNGCDQGFSDGDGGRLFLGSFSWTPSERATLTYSLLAGDFYDVEEERATGGLHSWVFELTPNDRWTLATTALYRDEKNEDAANYGSVFGQHLYYKASDLWKIGSRFEWSSDKIAGDDRIEQFGMTFGANWSPAASEFLTLRPEIRYDSANVGTFGKNCDEKSQICLGIDALCKF